MVPLKFLQVGINIVRSNIKSNIDGDTNEIQ